MRVVKSVSVEDLECRGSIKDSDVTRLRKAFASDPHIHENEAEALLRLNKACPVQAPTWSGFLADAIADYILNQSGSEGYITAEKSRWLIGKLSRDGWVTTRAEFDLLVSVLGRARWLPLSLATFALEQVSGAVMHGFGPLRRVHAGGAGLGPVPGMISEGEVALVRTILEAFGGESGLPVMRAELEILLGIQRSMSKRAAPAAWTDLLAKAVANVVLSEEGYAVPPRSVALRPGALVEVHQSPEEQVAVSLERLRHDYHTQSAEERAIARLERQRVEIVTGEDIASDETGWLMQRILTSARPLAIESAVMAYLDKECLIGEPGQRLGYRHGDFAA